MIIATGATLYIRHQMVTTAADAAFALRAFAGQYASLLFGLGLFGASLLAGVVLPCEVQSKQGRLDQPEPFLQSQ